MTEVTSLTPYYHGSPQVISLLLASPRKAPSIVLHYALRCLASHLFVQSGQEDFHGPLDLGLPHVMTFPNGWWEFGPKSLIAADHNLMKGGCVGLVLLD